jgi:hypothetical protein
MVIQAQHVSSDINGILSDDCCITVETTRYVPLKEENKTAYATKVCDMAMKADWTCASSSVHGVTQSSLSFFYHPSKNNHCDFVPPPLPHATTDQPSICASSSSTVVDKTQ